MSVVININGSVNSLVVNTNRNGTSITANGNEVWRAAVPGSKFHFSFAESTVQAISIIQSADYAVTIDWGDGSPTYSTAGNSISTSHNYAAGDYTMIITTASGEMWVPASYALGQAASSVNTTLTSLDLDDACIMQLGSEFRYCSALTSVTLPSTLPELPAYAFSASALTSIIVPDSVTVIGNSCFSSCASLLTIEIGSGMSTLDSFVFPANLTSLTVKATTPPSASALTFMGMNASCAIYVPSGSVASYQAASSWSSRAAYIQAIP